MGCEGRLMPIVATGTGGGPAEAMLGKRHWVSMWGAPFHHRGAASTMNPTLGPPCRMQGLEACPGGPPTTSTPSPTAAPGTEGPPLCPQTPAPVGPHLQEAGQGLKMDAWQGGWGHACPRCPGGSVLVVTLEQQWKEAQTGV